MIMKGRATYVSAGIGIAVVIVLVTLGLSQLRKLKDKSYFPGGPDAILVSENEAYSYYSNSWRSSISEHEEVRPKMVVFTLKENAGNQFTVKDGWWSDKGVSPQDFSKGLPSDVLAVKITSNSGRLLAQVETADQGLYLLGGSTWRKLDAGILAVGY